MPELSGELEGIGLGPLLSFLVSLPGGGELSITDAESGFTGMISVQDGRVTGSAFGEETGMPALEAIGLVLARGRFTFRNGGAERQPNLTLEFSELVEQLERLGRESARLAAVIPSLSAVPRVAAVSDPEEGEAFVDRRTVRLLMQIDGRRSVGDLARQYGLTTTLQRIAQLIELDLIHVERAGDRGVGRQAVVSSPNPRGPQPPPPSMDANGTTAPPARSPWARWRGPESAQEPR